jgi:hypothetical protein
VDGPGHAFEVWVSTRCPWHWLWVMIQVGAEADAPALGAIDELIGRWYLDGYNGTFGDAAAGRFHYITDPEPIGRTAVGYQVDLGRARFSAVEDLLRRLGELHQVLPLRRVLLGDGRVPE